MQSFSLKRIFRIAGLVWLIAISGWVMTSIAKSPMMGLGGSQAAISSMILFSAGALVVAFILGGNGK